MPCLSDPDLERTPLLDAAGRRMLRTLREHPDAPRWTYAVGDRLVREDLDELRRFAERLARERGRREPGPTATILQRLASLRDLVPHFRETLAEVADLEREWTTVPTCCRHDLAVAPWRFVPENEPLDRLVIYRTAGTTGHPIVVPHHPRAVACYLPLLERALEGWGVRLVHRPDAVSCALLSAQLRTYTYSTVHYGWGGAGFAKLNLRSTDWPSEGSRTRYLEAFAPPLLTAEPVALAELAALEPALRPAVIVSTSLRLEGDLAARLSTRFGCPVVDWYSTVETGPIAYACPRGHGMHVLPHDLLVEVIRPDGSVCPPGEAGEITVTGGRNPFLPLLRYRTGDTGRLVHDPCPCGDSMPRLQDLQGRPPILFRAADGTPVGSVDISRRLRELPLLRHAFTQRADLTCTLIARPRPDAPAPSEEELRGALAELFGKLPIVVRIDPGLGDEAPLVAFASELPFPGTASQ